MRIVFFSNYFNHHQKPFSDAMNSIEGIDYTFVATSVMPDFRKKLGYPEVTADYVLDTTKSQKNYERAINLAVEADVAIFMSGCFCKFAKERLKSNKLTFEYSERWLKKMGGVNLLSPNLWRHQMMYYRYGKNANLYLLCAGAFVPNDYYLMQSYKDRCFKWGYFSQVPDIDIDDILKSKRKLKLKIMWCNRFIKWKHPEMAIELASRLKSSRIDFEMTMYGNGPLLATCGSSINKKGLSQFVKLKGGCDNSVIMKAMRENHIFLLTSDKNEGWGVVANEAMSNGCTLAASNKIGAIPYLIEDGVNGCIFKSGDADDCFEKVKFLIEHRDICENYARNAYFSMRDVWSPKIAATRLLSLISNLQEGKESNYVTGPCSKATPIKGSNIF